MLICLEKRKFHIDNKNKVQIDFHKKDKNSNFNKLKIQIYNLNKVKETLFNLSLVKERLYNTNLHHKEKV